jgi:hypothetical protein
MSLAGCRSSTLIVGDLLVYTGQCKLISIHAMNSHASDATTIVVYDNVAGSGDIVAKMVLGAGLSLEYDMHGVICKTGLYVDVTAGTPELTLEFS